MSSSIQFHFRVFGISSTNPSKAETSSTDGCLKKKGRPLVDPCEKLLKNSRSSDKKINLSSSVFSNRSCHIYFLEVHVFQHSDPLPSFRNFLCKSFKSRNKFHRWMFEDEGSTLGRPLVDPSTFFTRVDPWSTRLASIKKVKR